MKIVSLFIMVLSLFGCKLKTEVDEQLLEDFRDPFKLTRLGISEGTYTNSKDITIQITADEKAQKWCLSEEQKNLPTPALCAGGAGPDGGWNDTSPTSFTLSNGDGEKKLYLWLLKSSGDVREENFEVIINLDTVSPIVTLVSALNPVNLSNEASYSLNGACSDSSQMLIKLNSKIHNTSCDSGLWSSNIDLSSLGQGSISVQISQKDQAGNISNLITGTIAKDTLRPTLTITNPNNSKVNITNRSSYTVSGTCSDDGVINLSGDLTDTVNCSAGTYSKNFDLTAIADGNIELRLNTADSNGNTSIEKRLTLSKDTVIPVVTLTGPVNNSYINIANQSAVVFNGTCSEDGIISITNGISDSITCSGGNFSKTLNLSGSAEGPLSLKFDLNDTHGNSAASVNLSLTKDTIAPVVTQAIYSSGSLSNLNTVTFGGSCESGLTLNVAGSQTSTHTCTSSSWSAALNAKTIDSTYTYNISQVDTAGNSSNAVTASWQRDTSAASIASMNVNSGGSSTGNNNVLIDLASSSTDAMISDFCFTYNSPSAPSSADSCWTSLVSIGKTVSNTFTLTQYPFQIGTILANYDIRVWIKDTLGNISVQTNTLNQDLYTISYQPDPPPSIFNVQATATDSPNNPFQSVDTTVLTGSDLYIKWNATDNNAIPAGSVKLYYSSDDVNFTQITTGLNNGVNGGCTLGTSTGCYKWTAASPLSSYYKIKVVVTDSGVSSVFSVSNALNTGSVKFLAGNTSLGIGGSANSAILIGEGESTYNDSVDPHSVAVTKKGMIFYKYKNKGLMYIAPETGLLKTLIPDTNSTSGNGGDASAATASNIKRVLLDYEGNIILWDNNQVRKIDLSVTPWQITKLFGGGADTSDGALGVNASLFSISGHSSFFVMPNGRIYYERSDDIWFYDPTDLKVKKHITLGGIGIGSMSGGYANYDNTNCSMKNVGVSFDKATNAITKIMRKGYVNTNVNCGARSSGGFDGVNSNYNLSTGMAQIPHPPTTSWSSTKFTGMDGKIYVLVQGRKTLSRYNPVSNTFETVLGSTKNGRCADGTAALSCNAIIMSAFVNEYGKIYFYDMGVIRTIDSSGNVQTIAGQPRNFGVGYKPTSARFSKIAGFDMVDDEVFVKNKLENQIIKFSLAGGNVEHIAGAGTLGTSAHDSDAKLSSLMNCNWSTPCLFKYDKPAQRLYHYNSYGRLAYIDLASGKWKINTNFYVQDSSSRVSYLGANNLGESLVYAIRHNGSQGGISSYQIVEPAAETSTRIYGVTAKTPNGSIPTALCDGVDPKTCALREVQGEEVQTQAKYKTNTSNWVIANRLTNKINTIETNGSATSLYTQTVKNIRAFEYRRVGASDYIYYCATDGFLYKRDVGAGTETKYTFPTPSMSCRGHSLQYNSSRDELVFIYSQNGLFGIASYKNP